jgi:hypothetical protein
MKRLPLISLALTLAIACCGKPDPVDETATGAAATLPDVARPAPSAIGEPHVATAPAAPLPAAATAIPASLQGRWGLSPADCMPGRSDAKGLLMVTSGEMRFYESRAVPSGDVQTDPKSMSGHFAFTGEGQSWSKYEALKIDKQMLVRTEANPTASFSYAKCS